MLGIEINIQGNAQSLFFILFYRETERGFLIQINKNIRENA